MITIRDAIGRKARVDTQTLHGRNVITSAQYVRATSQLEGSLQVYDDQPVGVLSPDGNVHHWLPIVED